MTLWNRRGIDMSDTCKARCAELAFEIALLQDEVERLEAENKRLREVIKRNAKVRNKEGDNED